MILELHKRPFARPLLVWIIGIIIGTYTNIDHLYIYVLVAVSVFFLIEILCNWLIKEKSSSYENRGSWGVMFCLLLLMSSIFKTEISLEEINRSPTPRTLHTQTAIIQQQLAEKFSVLDISQEEQNVISTLTLGYKKELSKETRQKFSSIGIAHLLAVSGFHVGIVAGFISIGLSFLPKNKWMQRVKLLILLSCIWGFTMLTGFAVSAVRAAWMVSLYFVSKFIGRKKESYNLLFVSAFCLLVYNPLFLFDIGFQLSYAAVFLILFSMPRFYHFIPVKHPVVAYPWNCLLITIAAQIGTVGLSLFYFKESSTLFLFTAIPFAILSSLIIPFSICWLLLPGFIGNSALLTEPLGYSIHIMMKMVDHFSEISFAKIHFSFDLTMVIAYYLILSIFLVFIKRRFQIPL